MANRNVSTYGNSFQTIKLPVSGGVTIEQGDMVAVEIANNVAVLGTDAAGIKFMGVNAGDKVDNSDGVSGDKSVQVCYGGVFGNILFNTITIGAIGAPVYCSADSKQLSTASGSNAVVAGYLDRLPAGVTTGTTGSAGLRIKAL